MSDTLLSYAPFVQMLENLREVGDGPGGPSMDARQLASELAAGLGLLSSRSGGITYEPQYADLVALPSLSPATANSAFVWYFKRHLAALGGIAGWDSYSKHLLWTVVTSRTGVVLAQAQRFETYDDLINLIKAGVPATGNFDESVYVFGVDEVDNADAYPQLRRARNSMFSSIRGRTKHFVRSSTDTYGVSTSWQNWYQDGGFIQESGAKPVNWYNNIARNLVYSETNVDPGSSNEDAIWTPWGRRTRWNTPVVGRNIVIPGGSSRGAVWDNTGSVWVTAPAVPSGPPNPYQVQAPWFLFDWKAQGSLDTKQVSSNNLGAYYPFNMIACTVFPVIAGGRYYAFLLYPFGADTWYTEYLDPAQYDLLARINYRHERQTHFRIVPPTQHNGTAETMFNLWKADKSGTPQLWAGGENWSRGNIDNDKIPTSVDVCRRNKTTGVRSPYTSLFKVRRRIPFATARIDPAFL